MQEDFHYYATACAAYLAGWSAEDSIVIGYSANFTDCCSPSFLSSAGAPALAATTQTPFELADEGPDPVSLQNITRIWASFHFLPYNLYAEKKAGKRYLDRYRLICNSNGSLVSETVNLAKNSTLQAAGIAMHVLADTWAHKYFAGTPSAVINNTNYCFTEFTDGPDGPIERNVRFRSGLGVSDDIENGVYNQSLSGGEHSIMSLGHGRAGHFPDYSFAKYRYMPAWGGYKTIIKDNPSDYMHAFCQMVYALKYLRGVYPEFELEKYDSGSVDEYHDEIDIILRKRRHIACDDWKAFFVRLTGTDIPEFDKAAYLDKYRNAEEKDSTFIGRYVKAAIAQKSMVTNRIFRSGNRLAGYSREESGGTV